jgi:general secretion pathway protein G
MKQENGQGRTAECDFFSEAASSIHAAEPETLGNRPRFGRGFTLLELMIAVAIVGLLASMAVPNYSRAIDSARVTRAIGDIRSLERSIMAYEVSNGQVPQDLMVICSTEKLDPWGTPYKYLSFEGASKGQMRKDRFLVPLNSTYDLYSCGKDKLTALPITAKHSHDDVIRASDGGYIGLASNY